MNERPISLLILTTSKTCARLADVAQRSSVKLHVQIMRVPYSVVSFTSEDSKYPIGSIHSASIRSPGWQSAPCPRHALDFVVGLGATADRETIQVCLASVQDCLAHRPLRHCPDQRSQPLGSFRFSDNSRTGYAARELKSAMIQGVRVNFIGFPSRDAIRMVPIHRTRLG